VQKRDRIDSQTNVIVTTEDSMYPKHTFARYAHSTLVLGDKLPHPVLLDSNMSDGGIHCNVRNATYSESPVAPIRRFMPNDGHPPGITSEYLEGPGSFPWLDLKQRFQGYETVSGKNCSVWGWRAGRPGMFPTYSNKVYVDVDSGWPVQEKQTNPTLYDSIHTFSATLTYGYFNDLGAQDQGKGLLDAVFRTPPGCSSPAVSN
jgi:hypothetical protein